MDSQKVTSVSHGGKKHGRFYGSVDDQSGINRS